MLKTVLFSGLFILLNISLQAAKFTERRNVDDFHVVKIFGNIKAELIQSDSTYILLESEVIALSKLTTSVEKGELKVELLNSLKEDKEIFAKIYYKQIDEISVKAAANLFKTDLIKAKFLSIKISQGALAHIQAEAENININSSQGAEIFISGKTTNLNAEISTGGKISAYKLVSTNVVAIATAGGYIKVKPIEKLEAKASAGGIVYYQGEVKTISQKVSLGGEVIKETIR